MPKNRNSLTQDERDRLQALRQIQAYLKAEEDVREANRLILQQKVLMSDPLGDINTPESTDDEDPDWDRDWGLPDLFIGPLSEEATILKDKLLAVPAIPEEPSAIKTLYSDPGYSRSAVLKVEMAKKIAVRTDLQRAMRDPRFWAEVRKVRGEYRKKCDRPGVRRLVGFYTFSNMRTPEISESESGEDDGDSSEGEEEYSETEDESDDEPGPLNMQGETSGSENEAVKDAGGHGLA